jgi:hypothetical protein
MIPHLAASTEKLVLPSGLLRENAEAWGCPSLPQPSALEHLQSRPARYSGECPLPVLTNGVVSKKIYILSVDSLPQRG